jgi:hypothetical protein
MMRKKHMRFNFKNSSLVEVFIIHRVDSEFWEQRKMEYFMERIHKNLRIPREFFNNIPATEEI